MGISLLFSLNYNPSLPVSYVYIDFALLLEGYIRIRPERLPLVRETVRKETQVFHVVLFCF